MLYEHAAGVFLNAAERFAEWLRARQNADGSWPLTIDRDGNVVVPTVGPGDIPNIAIALLRLHHVTRKPVYLDVACRALRYSLTVQVIPGSDHPYSDDPTLSGASGHGIRTTTSPSPATKLPTMCAAFCSRSTTCCKAIEVCDVRAGSTRGGVQ
ncbi:MAG: hypothetical protein IPM16_23970 [Chloroflexi bacterium]|nr:hypothetical protein [Chloroflexota bacterium]